MKTKTNISLKHEEDFNALTSGKYNNFALFSCFLDGEPTSAIVCINEDVNGNKTITPMFMALTNKMKLTDHEGIEPTKKYHEKGY